MNKTEEHALLFLKRGWSAFPLNITTTLDETKNKITKHPVFPNNAWNKYQKERVSIADVSMEWFGFEGIGIATGKISGITVIDVDTKDKSIVPADFFKTYTVESNNGYHLYFKYNTEAKQSQEKVKDIDIRNDGGFVFAPPTTYKLPNGKIAEYKILNNVLLLDFPIEWYRKTFNQEGNSWKSKIVSPIQPGSRNIDFTSIVGGLLTKFPQDDWEKIVWSLIKDKNILQKKPLSETELRTVFTSIAKKELQRRNTGGDIKDVTTEITADEIRVNITLERSIVCFKIRNIINNLLEATVITWIKKSNGLSHEMPFYLKIKSDSNKEQWVRILSKAFDKKEEKELYPWTILVTKAVAEVEKQIREHKQDFVLPEIVPKEVKWIYEPMIQEGQINTFFGLGGSAKTLISFYLASLVSDNGIKTILIDYENDDGGFADKMNKLLKIGANKNNFVYYDSEQMPLYEQVDKIKEVIKKHTISLVIVDSASLASGDSTSDEKYALRLVSALKLLKITIILIAHQRKTDGDKTPIGSIQFENQSRNVWNFKSMSDDYDISTLHVACKHTKANNTYIRKNPLGFKIVFDTVISITPEDAIDNFEEKFTLLDRIKKLLQTEPGLTYVEIAKNVDISEKVASSTLSRAKSKGLLSSNEGKWSLPYNTANNRRFNED